MASTMSALLEERLERSRKLFNKSASMEPNSEKSLWNVFSKKGMPDSLADDSSTVKEKIMEQRTRQNMFRKEMTQSAKWSQDEKPRRKQVPALQKGLAAIASSLSVLSETLGSAIEEGFSIMETRASQLISSDHRKKSSLRTKVDIISPYQQKKKNTELFDLEPDGSMQLKASQDMAMAMATNAKLLLHELKAVKADLDFTRDHCAQLQEENRSLREKLTKGTGPEEDDLVRQQLETLLAEKSRLAQENAAYARENQFLHEAVEFHQRTMQDLTFFEESLEQAEEEDEGFGRKTDNLETIVSI
ncbi:hypothetical protein O6H91_04G091000 [Diphasiastrum complanatum]|uniref:Uncharacterized protein n=1 Tax=Diphasiastrum complanatum TaxID=34168 RepID=A0ACC2DYY9_DIPCM|nr:hypothetical protein O6H91_Y566300 [Diphasiastrum complanatum]KAJ7559558.1 hypothetical protein O6H91_04G091000 [Diphasiastrum complanatum]